MATPRVRRIALTGGIGSGKSTIATMLVQHGVTLVDTDAIARALTAPGGRAIEPLRAEFGEVMLDATGALDRSRMRSLAFADRGARRRLEAILHPLILAQALEAESSAPTEGCVAFDVPLLAESSHWRARTQRVLVVDCSEATQIERVAQRPGWDREAAARVIGQQAPRAARRRCADAVIFNDGLSLLQLAGEVLALWQCWCSAD